jgi:hypothetical protein
MTKQEFIDVAAARYDALQSLNQITDFHEYEVEYTRIWKDLGRAVLEKNIGAVSNDKRKKKPYDVRIYNDQ